MLIHKSKRFPRRISVTENPRITRLVITPIIRCASVMASAFVIFTSGAEKASPIYASDKTAAIYFTGIFAKNLGKVKLAPSRNIPTAAERKPNHKYGEFVAPTSDIEAYTKIKIPTAKIS